MRLHTSMLLCLLGAALPGCGGCESSDSASGGADGGGAGGGRPPADAARTGPDAARPGPDAGRANDAGGPPADAGAPPRDAVVSTDAGGGGGNPVPGISRYLLLDTDALEALRARFDRRATHPCEIQVVGDSISESFLFLNPLTLDPRRPDMAYTDPPHCRIFGQPSIFLDVPQTAATGQTAGWGLHGEGEFGGVERVRYPLTYTDRDGGRQPLGRREAYPEMVTVLFGTNDLRVYVINRMSWDPSPEGEREARRQFLQSLRGIAHWALDQGVVPVLITTPPGTYDAWNLTVGDGPPLGPRWVEGIRALGREMRVPVFDLNRLFLDQPDWEGLLSDGVHPNDRGYRLMNDTLYEVYRDLRRVLFVR